MVAKGKNEGKGWGFGSDVYTLLRLKWIANEDLRREPC